MGDSMAHLREAAAAAHIDTGGETEAQLEAELAEFEAHEAGGTHHIGQQVKEGLFTKVLDSSASCEIDRLGVRVSKCRCSVTTAAREGGQRCRLT